jgi:hypothetical protein
MNELKDFLIAVKGVLDEVYLPPDKYIGLLNDNLEDGLDSGIITYAIESDNSGTIFYNEFLEGGNYHLLMPYLLRIYLRHPLLRETEYRYFFNINPPMFGIIGPKIEEHIKNDNHKENFYKNIDVVSKDFDDPLKQNFKRFLYYFYNYIIKDFNPADPTKIPAAAPRKRHLGGTRKKHLMKLPKRIKGFTIKKK